MLTDPPRPDLGVLPWSDWVRRTPPSVDPGKASEHQVVG
jgi:hypothetical protein